MFCRLNSVKFFDVLFVALSNSSLDLIVLFGVSLMFYVVFESFDFTFGLGDRFFAKLNGIFHEIK